MTWKTPKENPEFFLNNFFWQTALFGICERMFTPLCVYLPKRSPHTSVDSAPSMLLLPPSLSHHEGCPAQSTQRGAVRREAAVPLRYLRGGTPLLHYAGPYYVGLAHGNYGRCRAGWSWYTHQLAGCRLRTSFFFVLQSAGHGWALALPSRACMFVATWLAG